MCAVVRCAKSKKKNETPIQRKRITVNAESTGHRPTTDLGPHDIHPKVQNPIPNSPYSPDTPLPTHTSPDTHLSRHLSRHTSILCGVSTPTLWCQRPDTSAPRHTQQQRPDTAPTLPNTLSARYTPTLQGATPCGTAGTWNRRYAQRCRLCACVRCGLDCALRPILRVLHAPR